MFIYWIHLFVAMYFRDDPVTDGGQVVLSGLDGYHYSVCPAGVSGPSR